VWSGRRDSNPRPSPWQGDGFRPWRPLSQVEQALLRRLVRPVRRVGSSPADVVLRVKQSTKSANDPRRGRAHRCRRQCPRASRRSIRQSRSFMPPLRGIRHGHRPREARASGCRNTGPPFSKQEGGREIIAVVRGTPRRIRCSARRSAELTRGPPRLLQGTSAKPSRSERVAPDGPMGQSARDREQGHGQRARRYSPGRSASAFSMPRSSTSSASRRSARARDSCSVPISSANRLSVCARAA
jgi:hypothetical protein